MSDHLAAMYGVNQEVAPKINRTVVKPNENKSAKTRRINVGIVGYDLPSVEHVDMLEKKIEALEKLVQEQHSKMRRMEASISILKNALNRTNSNVGTLSKDLDQKIDRRD